MVEALSTDVVMFFFKSDLFNFELQDAALNNVDFGRHRIDFDPQF